MDTRPGCRSVQERLRRTIRCPIWGEWQRGHVQGESSVYSTIAMICCCFNCSLCLRSIRYTLVLFLSPPTVSRLSHTFQAQGFFIQLGYTCKYSTYIIIHYRSKRVPGHGWIRQREPLCIFGFDKARWSNLSLLLTTCAHAQLFGIA
jgi:hypothetical protein